MWVELLRGLCSAEGVGPMPITRRLSALLALGIALLGQPALAAAAGSPTTVAPGSSSDGTVWLCNPTLLATSPCTGDLSYATVPPVGPTVVNHPTVAASPQVDCFYAYPTVSGETTANADLTVEASETMVARFQAAPFSQVCRVFAPMYRQMTVHALFSQRGAAAQRTLDTAYASLAKGFAAFLAQEPPNRHFVLIGHSQGAAMLIHLIKDKIDPKPALRRRLVSAILAGGNLTVRRGADVGGAFQHIPLCHSARQQACAIAWSSFAAPPPRDAFFGYPGQGVSLLWGQTRRAGLEVACVNPVSFGPGFVMMRSEFPNPTAGAPYASDPGLYRSQCRQHRGASWLSVVATGPSGYPADVKVNARPIAPTTGRRWGYHDLDINLALQSLVATVAEESFYLGRSR